VIVTWYTPYRRIVLLTILFGAESSPTCARSRLEESKPYIQFSRRLDGFIHPEAVAAIFFNKMSVLVL
jgi:hypothetical protein